jgi:uncharacterized repeat protein (TIGR03803 family)
MRISGLVLCVLMLTVFPGLAIAGVEYSTIYSFGASAKDGDLPNGGLVFDQAGNVYGTTQQGGNSAGCNEGCGTAFELSPVGNGTWTESILYNFCSLASCADGSVPLAGLVIDSAGNLYGTAKEGGTGSGCGGGCGVVFELSPPSAQGAAWTFSVLWSFGTNGTHDAAYPAGRLTRDAFGNLYGTSYFGGSNGLGTVFEVSPVQGGGWSENVLYSFCVTGPPKCDDGFEPMAGVTFDAEGNLYGTASQGGVANQGTLYELSPTQGNGAWAEATLYAFGVEGGGDPLGAVNLDSSGNLYTTASTGSDQAAGGAVFEFVPQPSGGFEKLSVLFSNPEGPATPVAGVFLDTQVDNKIYGTAENGGPNREGEVYGVFGKTVTTIYAFCSIGGCPDGAKPAGSLTYHSGEVYSTTTQGGSFNKGVVFAIKP